MIVNGAAPTGASFLALNCAAIAGSKITTSQGLGATDLFKVWGSVRATSVGGELNNFPLGTLSGGTSGLSPLLTSAWTKLLFQRVGGAGSGTLYVEGPSWGRSAPVEAAVPTAPAAFSGPLAFSATAPAYLLSLDDAATPGDLYQVWGTNDGTMRTPASAAGAVLLGQLRGGGLVPPLLVIGYELVIVQCTAHAAATKVVAVETVNDGFTGLSTSTPPAGWQLGGNAPGGPMIGGSTDGSSVTVQALGGAGAGDVNLTSGGAGALHMTGGTAPSTLETAGDLTVQGAEGLDLFSGGAVSIAGQVVAVHSGDTAGDVDVTSPAGNVNVSAPGQGGNVNVNATGTLGNVTIAALFGITLTSTVNDVNITSTDAKVTLSAAQGGSVLTLRGGFANLVSAPAGGGGGTAQLGGTTAGANAAVVSDQVGGPSGGAIQLVGKLTLAPVTAPDVTESGPIGGLSAQASVDIAAVFLVEQTTPGLVLALQNPNNPAAVGLALVVNKGTAAFTMYGLNVTPSATPQTSRALLLWDGTAWGGVQ